VTSAYKSLKWITTTSNVCERLFSRAKLTLGSLRTSMTPRNLEILLFLICNRQYWDVKTVGKIYSKVHQSSNNDEEADVIIIDNDEENDDADDLLEED
jgi:hypothetical protein